METIGVAIIESIDPDFGFLPVFPARSGGTGLGLAITRKLVHAHGGNITVNSELGTGTAFVMEFPTNQGR